MKSDWHSKSSDLYLDVISGYPNEKSEIRNYLDEIGGGTLVEIGPGSGHAILKVVSEIQLRVNSGKPSPHVAILDVSKRVLDNLRSRLSLTLNKYDQQRFSFYEADAAMQLPFDSNSIAAINVSSIVHELFSYDGGMKAVDNFAREAARILRHDGLLIYRDPDGTDLYEPDRYYLRTLFSKGFFPFFSSKFLDRDVSTLHKPNLNYAKHTSVKRGDNELDFADYVSNTPDNSGTKPIEIRGLNGFSKEFQRHFVLFCKDVVPEAGYLVVNEEWDSVKVRFISLDSSSIFEQFCTTAETTNDGCYKVDKNTWLKYVDFVNEKISFLSKPVEFNISNKKALANLEEYLSGRSIPFEISGEIVVLSPSVCNLIYSKLIEISSIYGIDIYLPERLDKALKWGIREGEEHYFYGSKNDVIVRFAKSSLIKNENGYNCLCPLTTSRSRFHARSDHTAFLNYHLYGNKIVDGKRHIHFSKMSLEKAIPILSELLKLSREQVFETLEIKP